jgi:GNAT superfamily N-acetyltransferase
MSTPLSRRPRAGIARLPAGSGRRAFATLTGAFADDPPCRRLWPDAIDYEAHFPCFAAAFGGAAIDDGTAIATNDLAGVALWMAPGVGPDEAALTALIERSVPAHRQAVVNDLFGEMGRVHPSEPHWYLPLIGVAPDRQGQGIGGQLLASVLSMCDAAGLPAYLEATGRRCIPLYRRYGFEATGEIRVGNCPLIVPMLRKPEHRGA